jgi:hypothetical protein
MQPFDEAAISGGDGKPAKPVKAYVDEAIDLAMQELMLTAPAQLLAPKTTTITTLSTSGGTAGTAVTFDVDAKKGVGVFLPKDYLRFCSLYLPGWDRPVEALTDERWRERQYFEYTMTTKSSPCVFEDMQNGKQLHAFPYVAALSDSSPIKLIYVPAYDWNLGGTKNVGTAESPKLVDVESDTYITDALLNALVYSVAMKVIVYFGQNPQGMAALYNAAMLSALGAETELRAKG